TGQVLRLWEVGVAPYEVILVAKKAYVSNWGGRRPDANSLTGPAGRGMRVRGDPIRHIANDGSVSVIEVQDGSRDFRSSAGGTPELTGGTPAPLQARLEVAVGLHPSAMTLAPNGRYLLVANAASDTLSVIDTKNDKVVET